MLAYYHPHMEKKMVHFENVLAVVEVVVGVVVV